MEEDQVEVEIEQETPVVKKTEPVVQKERISKVEIEGENSGKSVSEAVISKKVKELNQEERFQIIQNAQNGLEDPNYKVTQMRNGNFRVVAKPIKKEILPEKIIKQEGKIEIGNKKIHLTNEQLLLEHIMNLEVSHERLLTKHKKLKNKFKSLESDVYYEADNETINQEVNEEPEPEPEPEPELKKEPKRRQTPVPRNIRNTGWRAALIN
jgi:hypothetical protein